MKIIKEKKVKCLYEGSRGMAEFITANKEYTLVEEETDLYKIIANDGQAHWFTKGHFY